MSYITLQTERIVMEVSKQKHLDIWFGIILFLCSAQMKRVLNTLQINITKIPLLGKHPNLALLEIIMVLNVCIED